jgi:serine/threonine protein kinase
MTPERYRRVLELFHAAVALDAGSRVAYLTGACAGEDGLREEVEAMLDADARPGGLLERSSGDLAAELLNHFGGEHVSAGTLLGPYRVERWLGAGGTAHVFQAEDTRLGRKVAVKVCAERFSGRFKREARVTSTLNHPNVCALYDIGTDYLVTELVEGETLREWFQRALPLERGVEIAKQVLEALGAAHRAGIVHRDLKPENIMVRFDGCVKVLDFGLAKWIQGDGLLQRDGTLSAEASLPGQLVGTVAYMSPEQIEGRAIDQRSDLFAFGTVLYEMLTGRHPWRGPSPVDTLHAILHAEPLEIEATSPLAAELAVIARRLLRKDRAERHPSAESVLDALVGRTAIPVRRDVDPPQPRALTSIAVLPFVLLSDQENGQSLSLGFADALITMLANLEDVVVVPTSGILQYPPGSDPAMACRELGVRHVLQGNVQKMGARWRVSLQLFDATVGRVRYSENHDLTFDSVFDVQDEIGRRIVTVLSSRFARTVPKSRDRYSSNPVAYQQFMSGLAESFSKQPDELRKAVKLLSSAVDRDPDFALAHATLSHVAMILDFEFEPGAGWLEKAEYHCQRALALDPGLPEAHLARAWILWSPARNFQHAAAIHELEQVLSARPNLERAHNRMATICLHIGRLEEARLAHDRAQRSSPKTESGNLWTFYLYSGDFARLEVEAARLRQRRMTKYDLHGYTLAPLYTGDLRLAEERLEIALREIPDEPAIISVQGMLHARRNEVELALGCVRRSLESPHSFGHTHHTHHQVACAYGALGDAERAMAWLERAVDGGFPCWPYFRVDQHLQCLRGTSAFERLMADLEVRYTSVPIRQV